MGTIKLLVYSWCLGMCIIFSVIILMSTLVDGRIWVDAMRWNEGYIEAPFAIFSTIMFTYYIFKGARDGDI